MTTFGCDLHRGPHRNDHRFDVLGVLQETGSKMQTIIHHSIQSIVKQFSHVVIHRCPTRFRGDHSVGQEGLHQLLVTISCCKSQSCRLSLVARGGARVQLEKQFHSRNMSIPCSIPEGPNLCHRSSFSVEQHPNYDVMSMRCRDSQWAFSGIVFRCSVHPAIIMGFHDCIIATACRALQKLN